MSKISIVIRTLNEAKHLPKLLDGIRAQKFVKPSEVELILVDSGSKDGTIDIAQDAGMKIIKISPEEFSFGRSINKGIEVASGDFIILISAHCFPVYDDWLSNMILPFADPRVSLVYGKQRAGETNKYSEVQLLKKWFPDQSRSLQSNYFCNNANCAIRRSSWLEHKYDEMLTGLEDLAWAKEEQKFGGKIDYQSEALIIHVHEENWTQVQNRYFREALALKQIEPRMKFGLLHFASLLLKSIYMDAQNARKDKCLKKEIKGIFLFRLNQYLGSYRGHKAEGQLTYDLKQRFYFPNFKYDKRSDVPKSSEDTREKIVYNTHLIN